MKFFAAILVTLFLMSCASVDEQVDYFDKPYCKKFTGQEYDHCIDEQ